MAAEAVISPSDLSAGDPARGKAMLTTGVALMFGATLAESYLSTGGRGYSLGNIALGMVLFVRVMAEPATWASTRRWARTAIIGITLCVALMSLLFFVGWGGTGKSSGRFLSRGAATGLRLPPDWLVGADLGLRRLPAIVEKWEAILFAGSRSSLDATSLSVPRSPALASVVYREKKASIPGGIQRRSLGPLLELT